MEPEDEPDDVELDGGVAGEDADVSEVEPASLLAGAFSEPGAAPSLASLVGLSGCFA